MSEISIELHVAVAMRDGTMLRADVYRPADGATLPVLMCRDPNGKGFSVDVPFDSMRIVRARSVVNTGEAATEGTDMRVAGQKIVHDRTRLSQTPCRASPN